MQFELKDYQQRFEHTVCPCLKRATCYAQSMARVNPQTYNSIKALTENPGTVVVIFSGSAKVE